MSLSSSVSFDPKLNSHRLFPWQTVLPALWACPILSNLTALLKSQYLRLHSAGKDCPRALQRGDRGSGTKPDPSFSAHHSLHTCTGGTVLFWGNVPQWEGRELLSAGRTGRAGRSVSLYSWLLLSHCRASGAWHRDCRQPRSQTLMRGLILSHQSLAWATPATAMQYLPLLLWRAKRWFRTGEEY